MLSQREGMVIIITTIEVTVITKIIIEIMGIIHMALVGTMFLVDTMITTIGVEIIGLEG
jgi:hypothetical protein